MAATDNYYAIEYCYKVKKCTSNSSVVKRNTHGEQNSDQTYESHYFTGFYEARVYITLNKWQEPLRIFNRHHVYLLISYAIYSHERNYLTKYVGVTPATIGNELYLLTNVL